MPPQRPPAAAMPVSILRPVRGLDPYDELTLRSGFRLSYPDYELILCCADAEDAAVPAIRRLMAEHPHVDARLLIGADDVTSNPKLNNLIKGWRAARHDWIIMADSNVLMPADYIDRLLAGWRADTGLLVRAADRLPAARLLGRGRVRLPQHLSGALAIRRRHRRLGLRSGQEHAVAARRPGTGGRHPGARRRGRRGRRRHQGGAPRRSARAARRSRFRPAAGASHGGAGVVAAGALGEAAARHVSAVLRAGDRLGQPAAARSPQAMPRRRPRSA